MARAVAVALATVIALTALAAAAVPAAGAVRPAELHGPAVSIHPSLLTITPLDANGDGAPFYDGLGSGTLYFVATGGTANESANVTITDQNASRDGVASPAAHWEIVFHGFTNDSLGTADHYQIPLGLDYSGKWNITLSAGGANVTTTFLVETYQVYISSDQDGYLPGHSGTAYWNVERDSNDQPFSQYSTLQVAASYRNTTGVITTFPLPSHTLTVGTNGSIVFTMPANASSGSIVFLDIWANQTTPAPRTNWSSMDYAELDVAAVSDLELSFLNCQGTCGTFLVGTPIEIGITVIATDSASASGLSASVSFYNGTRITSAPSGTPTSLTTNYTGAAAFVIVPTLQDFSASHNNSVSVALSDPHNSAVKMYDSLNFYLTTMVSSVRVQLEFGQATYYSGDAVTATWTLGGNNGSSAVPAGWTVAWFYAEGYGLHYQTLVDEAINSSQPSGTVTFSLPSGFVGDLYAYVGAINATSEAYNEAYALVQSPTILVNPSESIYRAGDQLSVAVTPEGQAFNSATFFETTTDSAGDILSSGVVSGNTFSVTIPKVDPPSQLRFDVIAQNATGGVIAQAYAEAELASGYRLTASVQTASAYSDGSYQPGQGLTVEFSFTTLGSMPVPSEVTVIVAPGATLLDLDIGDLNQLPGTVERTVEGDSGTISFTLPGDLPNGFTSVLVYAYPTSAGIQCSDPYEDCGAASQLTVNVQSSPSALNYELGAGSGFTVGWLILLILILVVAFVGVLWIRRRMGGSGGSDSGRKWGRSPKTFTSTPPESSGTGGSTGSSGSVGDAGSAGSSAPPLPPPAGGS